MAHIEKLRIHITETAGGMREYVQIISSDQFTVNVVLIADKIEVVDDRGPIRPPPRAKKPKGGK